MQTPGQTLATSVYGVTVDASGNVYAADWSNNRVLKVTGTGAVLSFTRFQRQSRLHHEFL